MPTATEKYLLGTLEEVNVISEKDGCKISIVKDPVDDIVYVKKHFDTTNALNVYKALVKIAHINLPKTFQVIELDGGFVVLEEYIHGATLQTALAGRPLPTEKVINITLQLCAALDTLHQMTPPLIHRDVNPANIMVTADGTVKLIDFDAAKEYKAEKAEDTTLLGTKAYAAPEQYGYAKTDARTDIYCLGATMYHMLMGKLYTDKDEMPKGTIGAILRKCLQIDPENRYPNITALKNDLEGKNVTRGFIDKWLVPVFPSLQTTFWKRMLLISVYASAWLLGVYMILDAISEIYDIVSAREESAVALGVITLVVIFCNMFGIRDKLPLFRNKKIGRTIGAALLVVIIVLVIHTILFEAIFRLNGISLIMPAT